MKEPPLKLGLCLATIEDPLTGRVPRWADIKACAVAAEQIGFDTVWVPDELLWREPEWPEPRGWWECVAVAGAVAASTSTIGVGSWVMSSLYRNPALVAKIVETLDEIAGGRFVFGIGSGSGDREAEAFGYPTDHAYSRFEEALEVLLPLLRTGRVDHSGKYHKAVDVELRPRGPRPGRIPLMIGASGPKMMRLAAQHADTWSWFATSGSEPQAFAELPGKFDRACEEAHRDPGTIGRSIGVFVEPTEATGASQLGIGEPLRGSAEQVAEAIREFARVGVTQVEIWPWPFSVAAVEALAPVVAAVHGR